MLVDERCGDIRGKLKQDRKFKCQTCLNQKAETAEDSQGLVEIVEYFINKS